MNSNPITNLAITSALWLTLLPAVSYSQDIANLPAHAPSNQAQIFLNAGNLTTIKPLYINFHAQQIKLEEDTLTSLQNWVEQVKKSEVTIHVYSYATPPNSRRDMTEKSAHHMATRKAFNRAINAKNALQNEGIPENLIALHAIGPATENPADQLHITLRNN